MKMRDLRIEISGDEASGKSTIAMLIAQHLKSLGYSNVIVPKHLNGLSVKTDLLNKAQMLETSIKLVEDSAEAFKHEFDNSTPEERAKERNRLHDSSTCAYAKVELLESMATRGCSIKIESIIQVDRKNQSRFWFRVIKIQPSRSTLDWSVFGYKCTKGGRVTSGTYTAHARDFATALADNKDLLARECKVIWEPSE